MTRWPAATLDTALQAAKEGQVTMTTDSALDARRLRTALYYRRKRNQAEHVVLSLDGAKVILTPASMPNLTFSEGTKE